jgi:transcriptional regulator GlxA family with amidase domain
VQAHLEARGLPAAPDPLVSRAIALLRAHRRWDGPLVRHLVAELPTSERQLERRFERVVGLTPKRYAALLRFERAVAALRTGVALGTVAIEAGYYDQAHFNRDFRRFAGTTPTRLGGA